MPALSIFSPGGASEIGLFGVDGDDLKIGTNHEEIELAAGGFALPGFNDDSSFKHTRGRHEATSGCGDGVEKCLALRFGEKDSRER